MNVRVHAEWIAVDWGTSTLRAWAMAQDGSVLASAHSTQGMGSLSRSEFEPALIRVIQNWLSDAACIPVLCCGMVGARQGWQEAPYRPVPTLAVLQTHLTQVSAVDPRIDVKIVPGLSQARQPDVMRGEETQIAGFLLNQPEFDGVLCLPGTHSKWVRISAGEIVSFTTFLTGELFELLSCQSVLRHGLERGGWDDASFDLGVESALSNPSRVFAKLFSIRAESLIAELSPAAANAKLSGLLIGHEIAGTKPYWLGMNVVILGAPKLCAHYQRALQTQSVQAKVFTGNEVVLDGLRAVHASMSDRKLL